MENLSLQNAPPPPPGQGAVLGRPPPPQGPNGPLQLPLQIFTTSAQLLDLCDKKVIVVLRESRKLYGCLRSFDQFANLVLQNCTERVFATSPATSTTPARNLYADIPRGMYLVRGENVLLLGEIDLDTEDTPPAGWEMGGVEEVHALAKAEKMARERGDKKRLRVLKREGFEGENVGEVLLG